MAMGIYTIEGPNGYYIGSAANDRYRWRIHRYHLNKGLHHSRFLQHAWDKYGADAFIFRLIEPVQNRCLLLEREQHWLDWLFAAFPHDGIYNVAPRVKGNGGILRGTHLTTEHRQKISASLTGRTIPPEEITRLQKMARMPKRGKSGTLISPEGELVTFDKLSVFARQHGLSVDKVSKMLLGTRKFHRGWRVPSDD